MTTLNIQIVVCVFNFVVALSHQSTSFSAEFLLSANILQPKYDSAPNAYAIVSHSKNSSSPFVPFGKTQYIPTNRNPAWRETFVVTVDRSSNFEENQQRLKVSIFDHAIEKGDNLLGSAEFNADDLLRTPGKVLTIPLKKLNIPVGQLFITVRKWESNDLDMDQRFFEKRNQKFFM